MINNKNAVCLFNSENEIGTLVSFNSHSASNGIITKSKNENQIKFKILEISQAELDYLIKTYSTNKIIKIYTKTDMKEDDIVIYKTIQYQVISKKENVSHFEYVIKEQ